MKKILFFEPNLNERGTSVATYDYAYFNETILNNKSTIVSLKNANLTSYDKFKNQFEVILVDNIKQISEIQCNFFYTLKYGYNDGVMHNNAKNLIHVVFPSFDPHGDKYVYVSKWLSENHGNNYPYVSHMVNLPTLNDDYKSFFNIKDQIVIGWYGGNNFEIPFARQAVIDAASKRKDIIFLFMNQDSFCDLENVIFISGTTDQKQKVAFINTCDVMIHARERGETFGLAIAEFSSKNKPIITYSLSSERNHIDILNNKGIYYSNYNDLINILLNIQLSDMKNKDWNQYKEYTPKNIIQQFNNVFL